MKKTLLTLSLFVVLGLTNANAADMTSANITTPTEYVVNDENIDVMFATSTDASFSITSAVSLTASETANTNQMFITNGGKGKSAIVAILLDFFLGGLGIHRAYLGTKTFTWVGYILTCGGIGGLVPFIDLIVLAVNSGDISKYEDNSKFFMW